MHRAKRLVLIPILAFLSLAVFPATAEGAPPSNDDQANAIAFSAVPYVVTADTTEATEDAGTLDACFSRAGSVWYRFAATADQRLIISTTGSDYDTVLNVYQAGQIVACSNNISRVNLTSVVSVDVTAGNDYYIMVSRFAAKSGGHLALSVRHPLTASVTLSGKGGADRVDGSALIHGTMHCSRAARWMYIAVGVRQRVSGGRIASGSTGKVLRHCSSTPTVWRLRISDNDRAFDAGPVRVTSSYWYVCEYGRASRVSCSDSGSFARKTVDLRWRG
jgi:hypothetical protein